MQKRLFLLLNLKVVEEAKLLMMVVGAGQLLLPWFVGSLEVPQRASSALASAAEREPVGVLLPVHKELG